MIRHKAGLWSPVPSLLVYTPFWVSHWLPSPWQTPHLSSLATESTSQSQPTRWKRHHILRVHNYLSSFTQGISWHLKFSQQWRIELWSYGLWHHSVLYTATLHGIITRKITAQGISCLNEYTFILSALQKYNFNGTEMLTVGLGRNVV
jgi:hypothetical protein